MSSEEMDGKFCLYLIGTIILLLGNLIWTGMILDTPRLWRTQNLKGSVEQFVKESIHHSSVDVSASPHNLTKNVGEFTDQYNFLLVELSAFNPFDFIIQYEVSQQVHKYEYICRQTADCFAVNYPLSKYKIMKFFVQTTVETFNVHGVYYLK